MVLKVHVHVHVHVHVACMREYILAAALDKRDKPELLILLAHVL